MFQVRDQGEIEGGRSLQPEGTQAEHRYEYLKFLLSSNKDGDKIYCLGDS
jgi:hypothetical protein